MSDTVKDATIPTDKGAALVGLALAARYGTHDSFAYAIGDAMHALGMTDADVADAMPVSVSAVKRWRIGASIPLPIMRVPVYMFFMRKLLREVCR